MPRLRNANACRNATRQALEWLNQHFGNDEQWAACRYPLTTYHKLPYLFAVAGCVEECSRALTWINANLRTPASDLLAAPAEEGKPCLPARIWEKAWVAMAAHLSGRFDMARPAVEVLARHQGQTTGGVYGVDTQARRRTSANVRTTASAGLAFLLSGLTKQARGAGRFLTQALQSQPEEKRFHTCLDIRGRPIRKYPKSEAAHYVMARARNRTALSFLGMPMVFLSKLHLATGEDEWLETAMDYYVSAEQYSGEARLGEDSGSFGWGAAALYRITRRRFYYDTSEQVAQAWIDRQQPDGSWQSPGANLPAAIARTTEAALCLLESIREAQ